jgi:hypothetical protein
MFLGLTVRFCSKTRESLKLLQAAGYLGYFFARHFDMMAEWRRSRSSGETS